MKNPVSIIILALVLVPFLGICQTSAPKPGNHEFGKTYWLFGTWQNTENPGMYESWSRSGETLLTGKSFMVKGRDTSLFETIELVQEGEGIFYIPTVKNQNEGRPIRFSLAHLNDSTLVFENPNHDFPQRITYTRLKENMLVAEISGTKKGKARKATFPMKKVD